MQTITINEQTIATLTANGFQRWTKGNNDRLYLNSVPTLKVTYHKTGSFDLAEFDGKRISNADAARLKASKIYIDLKTGELVVNTDYYRNTSYNANDRNLIDVVAEHVANILATIEDEHVADDAPKYEDGTEKAIKALGFAYTQTVNGLDMYEDTDGNKMGIRVGATGHISTTILNVGGKGNVIDGWDYSTITRALA